MTIEIQKLIRLPARTVAAGHLCYLWYSTYFGAQKLARGRKAMRTDTYLDQRVPIEEQAIYPYLFATIYLPASVLVLLNSLTNVEFDSAIQAYESMILTAKNAFCCNPTRIKSREMLTHPVTKLLQSIDGPTNCFPSLHVALVTLSYEILKNAKSQERSLLPAMKQSCIDICRATVKTRQHSILDVIGGIALSEQTYRKYFGGATDDLLSLILPELSDTESLTIKELIKQYDDPLQLLDALLARFHNLPKTAAG